MAIKTAEQIERDFYSMLVNSGLAKEISGKVYRDDMRPSNSKKEDVVMKFLSGLDSQTQTGIVILNCYVPDVNSKTVGRMVKNTSRIATLEELVCDFIHNNNNTEYRMEADATPISLRNDDIEQYFIYARIRFYRITE